MRLNRKSFSRVLTTYVRSCQFACLRSCVGVIKKSERPPDSVGYCPLALVDVYVCNLIHHDNGTRITGIMARFTKKVFCCDIYFSLEEIKDNPLLMQRSLTRNKRNDHPARRLVTQQVNNPSFETSFQVSS